ncbi:MAG: DUF2203 domain-containing protein [Candidatus Binataceae bacterium]|nr:DUF2203 domain-containing protein [Candidatus Binataceae bacterium]
MFSASDANELIPALEVLIRDLQGQAAELRTRIQDLIRADQSLDAMHLAEIVQRYPDLRPNTARMAEIASQIQTLGGFLKDIDQGLVDFPGEVGDDVVFLCWQFGEPRVTTWHPIDGGFAERRPIPGAPKTYLN